MFTRFSVTKLGVIALSFVLICCLQLRAQDASQMGISSLQLIANDLVNKGQFEEAIPLLEELVFRIEASGDSTVSLDFPLFILGVAHIQLYISSNDREALNTALSWFDTLEDDYPKSPKLKDALLKKVDVLLILGRSDDAIELIQKLIGNQFPFKLNRTEASNQLLRLTRIFYSKEAWEEGLPTFKKLIEVTNNTEDKAWGAAACFEAYSNLEQFDNVMTTVSALAYESEIRYMYRLNVAMLQTSDKMVENGRFADATILLNLINTNDVITKHHEKSIAKKRARIELMVSLGRETEGTEKLEQEISNHKSTLAQLSELPALRTDLLLRRARNYTQTERTYEAFWMFYDLMTENQDDVQIEFFTYATFTSALALNKHETAVEIGKVYRSKFPDGEFYSPTTLGVVNTLKGQNISTEYVQISKDFVDGHPYDEVAANLLTVWAADMMQSGQIKIIVDQMNRWLQMHNDPVFKDGLFYWLGLAQLQSGKYDDAISNFKKVLDLYPESAYAEDSLIRIGVSYFYASKFEESKDAFVKYTEVNPEGYAIDQAFYFLGELEKITRNYERALHYFKKADQLTESQEIHDSCAFSVGEIHEQQKRYDKMVANFKNYLERFGNSGEVTDAIYQLGRGYEFLSQPSEMLALYRDYIERYANDRNNAGVDTLIESFAEKYESNKTLLTKTVEFLDRLDADITFRTQIVTDRGFLFEYFFENKEVDQYLYNRLRAHPEFNEQLVNDLSPINKITAIYRKQLSIYPKETPVEFFRKQLNRFQNAKDHIGTTRMLMGLYRSDIVLKPRQPYDKAFLDEITPRVILYIADYARLNNLNFAVEAWNAVLIRYPKDDSSIVAYMRLADVSTQRGNFETAIDYLDTITKQFPGTPKLPAIILRQGELYTLKGDTESARAKYKYILSVPSWRGILHAQALFQIGQSYMAEQEYLTAHGYFERTFVAYSHFGEWAAHAYLEDAEALIALNQKEDAIATLTEALEVLSQNAPDELIQSIRDKLNRLTS